MADSYSFSSNSVPTTSWGKEVTGEKSAFLALILSFLFPGIGIAYAGKVGLGVIIFILSEICLGLTIALAIFLIGFVFTIPYAIFWIYGMYKAYTMCGENNRLWAQYLASR